MTTTDTLTNNDEATAEDTAEEPDAAEDAATADAGRNTVHARRWHRRMAIVTAALLTAALAALGGFFGWQYYQQQRINDGAQAALHTANAYAVTLTSVDTNNLDENFAAVLTGATGEFHDMYAQSSAQLRKLLIDHKATGHGVVLDSAIKSASKDEVIVLLFVDQTVSNTEIPDPRVDRSRMVMTMRKVDGQWKAAKIELP
ncbi:hypothetical protein [Mycolicibacterium sp. J2]|uniref:hypothetical protein n=1 Tax=Mycolicibacterium sp. J2 TaxID=2993511 RepID=UPI00224A9CD6|nr:hypothetical protein [Mycolicibacterium sp. J2]MCX2714886.1 hypothetical protein [Mycolicibacterium sp. J2]